MEYLPVFILMSAGFIIGTAALTLSHFVGPKIKHHMKANPFECGVPALGSSRQRVSVRFYLIAILFLLFDVEIVFFVPWAIVYREFITYGPAILWIMGFFFFLLWVGLFYELKKGALKWD